MPTIQIEVSVELYNAYQKLADGAQTTISKMGELALEDYAGELLGFQGKLFLCDLEKVMDLINTFGRIKEVASKLKAAKGAGAIQNQLLEVLGHAWRGEIAGRDFENCLQELEDVVDPGAAAWTPEVKV